MRQSQGQAIHLKNYQAPAYNLTAVNLDITLHASRTVVKSTLTVERGKGTDQGTPLKLDGDELQLVSVFVDDKKLDKADYRLTPEHLSISKLPRKPGQTHEY